MICSFCSYQHDNEGDRYGCPNCEGRGLEVRDTWQTQARGSNDQEYKIYLAFADDGNGGDLTRNGAPLKTYEEWLNS